MKYKDRFLYSERNKYYFTIMKILDNDGDPSWCDHKSMKEECKFYKKDLILEYKRRQLLKLEDKLKKLSISELREIMNSRGSKKNIIKEIKRKLMNKTWKQIDRICFNKTVSRKKGRKKWTRKFKY